MVRATCETCQGGQPVDWKAGDLCVHCGGAVRPEERCFWCNTWQPVGGFCRGCGAEQIGNAHYGAARMLTLTGADMFSIPKLVREMEPARLAVFGDKYARQRGVVSQHVDDLLFVERFCKHKGFAAKLEEEMTSSLPWADATAAAFSHPSGPIEGIARLRHIITHTPVQVTRSLATIALYWSCDWAVAKDVGDLARYASADDVVGQEALLALTWWRAVIATNLNTYRMPIDALADVTLREEAAVRLAAFGRDVDPGLLAAARASHDADLAFAAALVTGDVALLTEKLRGDPISQRAASSALADRHELAPLQGWLRGADALAQRQVIHTLAHDKNGRGGILTPLLLELMERTDDEHIIVDVGRLLARETTLAVAMRVAAACRGEIYVVQALMNENTGLGPAELAQVAGELAKRGYLTHSKYGVSEAAKRGALPDDFVASVFDQVSEEAKVELCRFAESQLEGRDIESLHVFMLRVVFGPYSAKVHAAAWWSLSRGYKRVKYGWDGPLELTPASIERFFPSVPSFMERFIAVLGDFETLKEVGYYDFIYTLVRQLDDARIEALRAYEPCERLFAAMDEASKLDVWSPLRDALRRAVRRFRREEEAA